MNFSKPLKVILISLACATFFMSLTVRSNNTLLNFDTNTMPDTSPPPNSDGSPSDIICETATLPNGFHYVIDEFKTHVPCYTCKTTDVTTSVGFVAGLKGSITYHRTSTSNEVSTQSCKYTDSANVSCTTIYISRSSGGECADVQIIYSTDEGTGTGTGTGTGPQNNTGGGTIF